MAFYTRTRQDHWLHDKDDQGRLVILEDESVWEIDPSDRLKAGLLLRMPS